MSANNTISEYHGLKSQRETWNSLWQSVLEWTRPHDAQITETHNTPDLGSRGKVHDTKGIEAVGVLTSAHMSYITPLNEDWLGFSASRSVKSSMDTATRDEADAYFKECSEVCMEAIAGSNFYPAFHALYRDRSTVGTGAVLLRKSKKGGLNFQYVPAGTYCFTEGEDYLPNSFFREYQLTLAQAVKEFGEDKFGSKIATAITQANQKPELWHVKHPFLHVVREREGYDPTKEDMDNMPFADENICLTDSVVLIEGGFQEFPYLVSRYERWGDYIWGYSPAMDALPNMISANYIRRILKTLGEVAAFPRILMLAGEKRQVDLRAGGKTVVSEKSAAAKMPQKWGTEGRYDIGMALLDQDHAGIEQFFHVPLFRMFASLDKQMTATEVAAREREKLLMFAPSFTQFVTDMRPQMLRVFSMLAREGHFPTPPAAIMQDNGDGTASIPTPDVIFQSKIALAIKALRGEGFDRVMARLMGVAEMIPDTLDNFDFDQIFRDLSRNEGMPSKWSRGLKAVEELRQARAQAQKQAEQLEQAEQAASAVGKAGGAKGLEQLGDMVEGGAA